MTRALPDVKIGQLWADNDKRAKGRVVKVVAVPLRPTANPLVIVEVVTLAGGRTPTQTKRTMIATRRFRPNSTGYRLVKDA